MAAGLRGGLGLVSWVLLAASIVFMFFVVLSGVKNTTPLNKTYFLQADTSSISGARPISQWTYFYVCGAGNENCGAAVPGLSLGDAWGKGATNVPSALFSTHHHATSTSYYYIWRFGWVFYLMGLTLAVFALLAAFLSCLRIGSAFAGILSLGSWFFFSLGASLMTAEFVKARNQFHKAGMSAKIGRYAFGWTWGAWACITLATLLLFSGSAVGGRSKDDNVRNTSVRQNGTRNKTTNGGFFRRQRSTRSRGSFIDNDGQRRVKEEYA